MMTLKQFKNKIKILNEIDDYCKKLSKITKIDELEIRDSKLNKLYIEDIINDITTEFGKEGWEWVDWWTYDKRKNPELTAYDLNGEEIDTVEKLYSILLHNKVTTIDPDED